MAKAQIVDYPKMMENERKRNRWIEKLDGLVKLIEGTECQLREIDRNYSVNS